MQNQKKSGGMNGRIILGIGALIIIVALIIGIVVLTGGEDEESATPVPTTVVEASPTDTDIPATATPTEDAAAALATDQANQTATATQWTPTPTETPIPAGYPGGADITANDEWTPVTRDFDYDGYTVTMVLVPKGCFQMGNDESALYFGTRNWQRDGVPDGGTICFEEPFWLDQYEVSNAQLNMFAGEDAIELDEETADLPNRSVSWNDALAFCTEKRGGRLPTEAEWEYSARGPDGLSYPWGNEFDATRLNCSVRSCPDDNYPQLAPVWAFETGQSWVGAYNLAGNAWEWTNSIYQDYPYDAESANSLSDDTDARRAVRGGDAGGNSDIMKMATRYNQPVSGDAGVRCARDYAME